ncbi:prenyltransferase/squalene oxidase repeat-containing protein [Pelosinus fermentans]|uniref:Glycosyl transferase group 1 n=1 Tax=Pelosinus fermentans JBW45 TaxID=1192197 RepID=I9NVR8_9FIRM|nr:prenyltransferase/squalene oxidase repeat-containing protein [Pelosinus fermentans]AJQ29129.1 glycosyl transferase group 1 [Pelosinus fermentans JBW45]
MDASRNELKQIRSLSLSYIIQRFRSDPQLDTDGWHQYLDENVNVGIVATSQGLLLAKKFKIIDENKIKIEKALNTVLKIQRDDGGWAYKTNLNDRSSSEPTSWALICLCEFYGLELIDKKDAIVESVYKGITWLLDNLANNAWGMTKDDNQRIYTSALVLDCLRKIIEKIPVNGMQKQSIEECIENASNWIISIQNSDGGWGEYKGKQSTCFHTACVLDTVFTFKKELLRSKKKAIDFLCSNFNEAFFWHQNQNSGLLEIISIDLKRVHHYHLTNVRVIKSLLSVDADIDKLINNVISSLISEGQEKDGIWHHPQLGDKITMWAIYDVLMCLDLWYEKGRSDKTENPSNGEKLAMLTTGKEEKTEVDSGKIILIADSWGTKLGGINSFNYDFCRALGLVSTPRIVCVVKEATPLDIAEANQSKVTLIPLDIGSEQIDASRSYEIIDKVKKIDKGSILWWVGHDTITGEVALKCREQLKEGKCAIIHHMSYPSYYPIKYSKGISSAAKEDVQRKVFTHADRVFAIGPKLRLSAEELRRKQDIIEIIPGLTEEISPSCNSSGIFSAIVFGRLDSNNEIIKQGKLAVKAFARAFKNNPCSFGNEFPRLYVMGLEAGDSYEEKCDELRILASQEAGRLVSIIAVPYCEDRNKIFENLSLRDVCIMPSWHEGFGLVGMEAIAGEVPIIISKNSGLYEMIKDKCGSPGLGCIKAIEIKGSFGDEAFSEDDLEQLTTALLEIASDKARVKSGAKSLKNMLLSKNCTWENAAQTFLSKLDLEVARVI